VDNVIFYALAQNIGVVDVKLIQDFCFLFKSELVDLHLRKIELVLIEITFLIVSISYGISYSSSFSWSEFLSPNSKLRSWSFSSELSASLAWPPMMLSLREAFCLVKASISFLRAL